LFIINLNKNKTMKKAYIAILIGFLWVQCIGIVRGAYTDPLIENENKGEIRGKVVDVNGDPVIGAQVLLSGTLIGEVTDFDGKFVMSNLKEQTYKLVITAVGFSTIEWTVLASKDDVKEVLIQFQTTGAEFPEIVVLGKSDRLFSKIPGSAAFIGAKEINKVQPLSGNEVFRRVAGLHAVDEEGLGMRLNLGIRGLDPDRSRNVLVLEDGIPVALAPYGEPELYFTPTMDRMAGVEVLKGSGQILFGPQTIGGVINYQSLNPPAESKGLVRMNVGQGGFFSTFLSYGNSVGAVGYQINYLKKRADQVGLTGFDMDDLNTKFLLRLSDKSTLSLKASIYQEISNSTYIGMTQSMYDQGGLDFVHMAPDDLLKVRRIAGSASHDYKINNKLSLKTTAFAFETTRNWRRQDFSSNGEENTKPNNWTGVTWGDESIPNGAIYMRNSTGNRNRRFEVAGLESSLKWEYNVFNLDNKLIVGGRYLHERAYEQRINGSNKTASSGNLVEDEIRTGEAISAYFQNKTQINKQWQVHFGARLENFQYERDILRRSFAGQVKDTSLVRENTITEIIPGAGFSYNPWSKFNVFGGVHSGFAPPRVKDAISGAGEVYELDAERSTNWELGLRTEAGRGLFLELTGFYTKFSNQVIPVSESSGAAGFGLINGGETTYQGIEGSVVADFGRIFNFDKYTLLLDINYTWVDARFAGDRIFQGESVVGNRTPYAPELLLNSSLTFEAATGWSIRFTVTHVGDQFTDPVNSIAPAANGRNGLIESYTIVDASLIVPIGNTGWVVNGAVKNLMDERYIVSRRPQGIRVGMHRFVTAGLTYQF
jgi:Fe(3+) dicitrate transport protein